MAHPEENLRELGLSVPEAAKPVAVYVPAVRSGQHVFTSGQLPMRSGELITTGGDAAVELVAGLGLRTADREDRGA